MIEYKIFRDEDCPEKLFRFRYDVYIREMHRKQKDACHATQSIRDELDSTAHNAAAFKDGEVIACQRLNFLRDGPVGIYDKLYKLDELSKHDREHASICTRLMVSSQHRGSRLTRNLLKFIYEYGKNQGMKTCYIDCNAELVRFFEKYGYHNLGQIHHYDYDDVTLMRLDVFDSVYLESIHSPFVASQDKSLLQK